MTEHRNPGNSGTCPFYIDADDVFTAEASIRQCVACATRGYTELERLKEDFRQFAYLTILEETPKYDPTHPSHASFVTFIKSRVCSRLWSERRKELRYLPFPLMEAPMSANEGDDIPMLNPLSAQLYSDAFTCESLEDEVIQKIEAEELQVHMPAMLARLTEKERKVVTLKYFQDCTGVEIAEDLGISEGRVSQLTKSALAKLKTAYLHLRDTSCVVF